MIFVGCTVCATGAIVVAGFTDGVTVAIDVGMAVLSDGGVVGESVGAIVVGVLDGGSVLIDGLEEGVLVGADVVGGFVGELVGVDVVGGFVGALVGSRVVGDVVGINVVVCTGAIDGGGDSNFSIVLMTPSIARSVKVQTMLLYLTSSSSIP